MWACPVACPVHEITSFVVDSSRSRKSVFQLFKSHTSFSVHHRIEGTGQAIVQAANFAGFSSRPNGMGSPPPTPKRFSPLHPRKAFSCRGPWPDCFQFSTRAPSFPLRSAPNCKQTGIGKGGAVAPPSTFDWDLRMAQSDIAETTVEAQLRHILNDSEMGLVLARNAPSIVQPVCACQGCVALSPLDLHLDSARRAWGLCS